MKRSDEKFLADWEAVRRRGRLKYGLIHGPIWGVLVFLIHGLFALTDHTFTEAYLSKDAGIYLLLMVAGGILMYTTIMWPINDRFYRKKRREGGMQSHTPGA